VSAKARLTAHLRPPSVACHLLDAAGMKEADHPRILELMLGRMLELVVFSVEGVRERLSRTRVLVH
jgi:hypothetical protein